MAQPLTAPTPTPDGLSSKTQAVWLAETRRTKSAGRLLLLEQCLRALDRADAFEAVIAREGLTTTTKTTGAVHVHPLAKLEAEERRLFVTLARALHLEWRMGVDG